MSDQPVDEHAVQEALERYFEVLELGGEPPDLRLVCGDDEALQERVRTLIVRDPIARGVGSGSGSGPGRRAEGGDADLVGAYLGEFRIERQIGAGGMGDVYLAHQEGLNRPVAIKVLRPSVLRDRRARLRLEREAIITGRLDHPNIVPVYAVGEERGLPYIAMKWLAGPGVETLAGKLAPAEVARLGAKVARALDEAHQSGVLHRDVKPANVILDAGEPFVVDFGFAVSTQLDAQITQSGTTSGTLAYMSPEQFGGSVSHLDARTDVYSLGATLYELLSGAPPFELAAPESLIRDILLRDVDRLRLPAAHRDLESIVVKAMEKNRERRYDSAAAFAEDLERHLRGEPTLARPIGFVGRIVRLASRHRRASAAILVGTVTVTGLAGRLVYDRVRAERVFAADRAAFAADLEHGDLVGAAAGLARLDARHGGDPRVTALDRRLAAHETVAELLDLIVVRNELQSGSVLDPLLTRLEATEAAAWLPNPLALGLAVVEELRGDRSAGLGRLDGLDPEWAATRGAEALRLLLEGGEPASVRTTGRDALDHVLTYVALRLASAPVELQSREIECALQLEPSDFRARFASVNHWFDRGEYETARAALEVLSPPRRAAPALDRLRIYLDVITGHIASAEARIAALGAAQTPWDDLVRATLLDRTGSPEQFEAALDAVGARWGEDVEYLLLARGNHALERADASGAIAAFNRLAATSAWVQNRESAEAGLLMARLLELPDDDTPEADGQRAALRSAATALLNRARLPDSRVRARVALARIHRHDGEYLDALHQLEAARSEDSLGIARREFADLIANAVVGAGMEQIRDRDLYEYVHAAIRDLRVVLEADGRSAALRPLARQPLLVQLALLSCEVRDWEAAEEALEEAYEIADREGWVTDDAGRSYGDLADRFEERVEQARARYR